MARFTIVEEGVWWWYLRGAKRTDYEPATKGRGEGIRMTPDVRRRRVAMDSTRIMWIRWVYCLSRGYTLLIGSSQTGSATALLLATRLITFCERLPPVLFDVKLYGRQPH